MDLDHITFGIEKENLVPFSGEGRAVVGIGDAAFVEDGEKGGKIVGAKGDVATIDRVDHLAVAEGRVEFAFGKVHLHLALGGEFDLAGITSVALGLGARELFDGHVIETEDIGVKVVHPVDVFGHEVDVVEFEFHGATLTEEEGCEGKADIWLRSQLPEEFLL